MITDRRLVCPYCQVFSTYNDHTFMRHMAENCPAIKQPASNLEQRMETNMDGQNWHVDPDIGSREEPSYTSTEAREFLGLDKHDHSGDVGTWNWHVNPEDPYTSLQDKLSDLLLNRKDKIDKRAEEIEEEIRQDKNGEKENSYGHIAVFWENYLAEKDNSPINETDVAMMLALFKVARWQKTGEEDHLFDMYQYAKEAYNKETERD